VSSASSLIGSSLDVAKEIAESANERIESLIETAIEKAECFTERFEESGLSLEAYENLIDNLGNDLVNKALRISQSAIEKIKEIGYNAICYYVPVKLGYKIFMVDPILIIDD
jgi:F0F1-type ATP synthase membrane subunit b/b'